ncbi:phage polarity suppression protein [Salmonella enterica]|nr:phage polarity suppression protein [Salmonella enterica subsp. houtenae]ECJ6124745.1 phage polarity suppression protein [Salmonella enterica]EEC0939628.1 phage polarity suppression protein [Salmonella enterica subsp. enterica serovar Baguida]HCM1938037.1 phage polarity suppression protein [Salmonella enterica subsp. houtenae serovar 57:z4,z23:-]EIJ5071782.1 phage polarity suppression protein [Salmonella enterica]
MTTLTLQQACDACQTNKTAWLNRKTELAAAMQEYQELLLDDNVSGSRRLQMLRDLIDVKKWEVNQAAALAPELMGIKNQPAMIKNRALDRSVSYLREALSVWLTAGDEINYSAQDKDILTAIRYRPDAPSRDDNREKFTPVQNMIYTRRRAGLAAQ